MEVLYAQLVVQCRGFSTVGEAQLISSRLCYASTQRRRQLSASEAVVRRPPCAPPCVRRTCDTIRRRDLCSITATRSQHRSFKDKRRYIIIIIIIGICSAPIYTYKTLRPTAHNKSLKTLLNIVISIERQIKQMCFQLSAKYSM